MINLAGVDMERLEAFRDVEFVSFDTETTGLDEKARIVELGAVSGPLDRLWDTVPLMTSLSYLVDPECPIPAAASGIHHITNSDVDGQEPMIMRGPKFVNFCGERLMVAHNLEFDRRMLTQEAKRCGFNWASRMGGGSLCTLRLAQHIYPDMENYKLQTLRYALLLDVSGIPRVERFSSAHSAFDDALLCAKLLGHLIVQFATSTTQWLQFPRTPAGLIELAASTLHIRKMPFGKHAGTSVWDIPGGYIKWALSNMKDLDDDLRWSLEHRHEIKAEVQK